MDGIKLLSQNGVVVELTNNLMYIVRTEDYSMYDAFSDRSEMLDFLNSIFEQMEQVVTQEMNNIEADEKFNKNFNDLNSGIISTKK